MNTGAPIKSLEEFKERIVDIKKNLKSSNLEIYYRGDKYDTPTQCNLFRKHLIKQEDINFSKWVNNCSAKNICNCKNCESLMCLAYMQHYKGNTRLLDFTSDPLVALRFACGKDGENCKKKVTFYSTEVIDLTQNSNPSFADKLMDLVKSNYDSPPKCNALCNDYFIKVDQSFPRIQSQKGLFLFMGNKDSIYSTHKQYPTKVEHELSNKFGRGKNVKGQFGVITIHPKAVEKIRNELENIEEYKMDYLMK